MVNKTTNRMRPTIQLPKIALACSKFNKPEVKSGDDKPAANKITKTAGNTIATVIPPAPNNNQKIGSSERTGFCMMITPELHAGESSN